MRRFVDPFVVALLAMLLVGLLVPIPDEMRAALDICSDIAIVVLFFLYGARLATSEIVAGLRNVRMQGTALAVTFVLFPVLGLAAATLARPLLGDPLADGVLYLSLLPSTVQSSVALVGVARGNVAATITSATVSNVLGMVLTPLLVLWLMHARGDVGTGGIRSVLLLLLAPFVVGQLLQPVIGRYVRARKRLTTIWDRSTVLLVVLVISAVMLAIALAVSWWGGRALGLTTEDRIALLMCGSQKSLATGLPMLGALFPAALAGPIAVPVIVFHQLQLIVSSVLARRLARRPA